MGTNNNPDIVNSNGCSNPNMLLPDLIPTIKKNKIRMLKTPQTYAGISKNSLISFFIKYEYNKIKGNNGRENINTIAPNNPPPK